MRGYVRPSGHSNSREESHSCVTVLSRPPRRARACFFASPPAAVQLPVGYNGILGMADASATASPPGANNWSCKPSGEHPYPVVLVHGTSEDMADNWQALAPLLHDHGCCVFALNYCSYTRAGRSASTPPATLRSPRISSRASLTGSLAATGASRVDLVGHSQGGMPRYHLKFLRGASKVNTPVRLAPSNHGTTLDGLFTLASYFPGWKAAPRGLAGLCRAGSRVAVPDQPE